LQDEVKNKNRFLSLLNILLLPLYIIAIYFLGINVQAVYSIPPHKIIRPVKPVIRPSASPVSKEWQVLFNKEPITNIPPVILKKGKPYIPILLGESIGTKVSIDAGAEKAYLSNPKSVFVLTSNSKSTNSLGAGIPLSAPALWYENTLYVPADFLVSLGGAVSVNSLEHKINILKRIPKIKNIRPYWGKEKNRIILDIEEPLIYDIVETQTFLKVKILGAELVPALKPPSDKSDLFSIPIPSSEKLIKQINVQEQQKGIVWLNIQKGYKSPNQVFPLAKPDRIILDFPKLFNIESVSNIYDGLRYINSYKGVAFGPLNINVLDIDPNKVFIKPVLAGDEKANGFFCEKVSIIAKRHKALAAINGTYFSTKTYNPLGLLLISGDIISSPLFNRSVLFITRKKEFFIENTKLAASMLIDGENITVNFDSVNLPRYNNQLVLYTPKYGKTTKTSSDPKAIEFSIASDGTVLTQGDNNLSIPQEGFVIAGHGKAKDWLVANLRVGKRIFVYQNLSSIKEGIYHAISGGPTLLENGKIYITAVDEQFKTDITQGRAPRTAIGLTRDNRVIFITVDGRQNSFSVGVTLKELAAIMQEYGVIDAMNLDGGGSTTMVVNGRVVNSPSGGSERPVNNAVLLTNKFE